MKAKKALRVFFRVALPVLSLVCLFYIFFNSMRAAHNAIYVTNSVSGVVTKVAQKVTATGLTKTKAGSIAAKIGHAGEFALFAFLLSAAALQRRKTAEGLPFQVFAVSLFAAVTDEYLQTRSVGRTPSVTDVIVDLSGALTGLGLALLIGYFALRRRAKKENASP